MEVQHLTVPRKPLEQHSIQCTYTSYRGYVALAIVSTEGETTKEIQTGSSDRAQNMVTFAEEALKLLLNVLESK